MYKNYDLWFIQQEETNREKNRPSFKEREIWRCEIGINIGDEICGEGENFTAPVLILRKYTKFTFLGAPLSKEEVKDDLRVPIDVYGKKYIVLLDQVRSYDARRLRQKFAKHPISKRKFNDIREVLRNNL